VGSTQAKPRAYALKVESIHEDEEESGAKEGAGEMEAPVEELEMPPLEEPELLDDESQFRGGSEEEIFVLKDLEEREESLKEETLNAMRTEGEGDFSDVESCHIAAVRPALDEEIQPYRARAYRSELSCPVLKREARQCIALWIELDGKPAYTLFDTRSTTDMVSPSFAWVMGLNTFRLEKQLPLLLGCPGSKSSIANG
jgi:hypothetical protein